MIEGEDEEDEDQPRQMGMEWETGQEELFPNYEEEFSLMGAARDAGSDLLTQALSLTDLPPSSSSSSKEGLLSPKYATLHPPPPQDGRGGGRGTGGPGDGMLE